MEMAPWMVEINQKNSPTASANGFSQQYIQLTCRTKSKPLKYLSTACLHVNVCLQACTKWWSSCCPSAWSCWCSAGSLDSSARWPAVPNCWLDPHPTFSSAVSPHRCFSLADGNCMNLACTLLWSESFAWLCQMYSAWKSVWAAHCTYAGAYVCVNYT